MPILTVTRVDPLSACEGCHDHTKAPQCGSQRKWFAALEEMCLLITLMSSSLTKGDGRGLSFLNRNRGLTTPLTSSKVTVTEQFFRLLVKESFASFWITLHGAFTSHS